MLTCVGGIFATSIVDWAALQRLCQLPQLYRLGIAVGDSVAEDGVRAEQRDRPRKPIEEALVSLLRTGNRRSSPFNEHKHLLHLKRAMI